jgi:glycosyltransferase involved in cell wall biosynthesis
LDRALESVLNQTYDNIEVIVVDDCSSDDTVDYLKQKIKSEPRLHFMSNEVRSGACVSRNKAIEIAKGEYITGLDDDDYFTLDRIEAFVIAALHSDGKVLFSNNFVLNKNGERRLISRKKQVTKYDLLYANFIGNQIFVKTSLMRENTGFSSDMPAWQDLECWFRLLHFTSASLVDAVTYVVDVSHEHERISSSKVGKIEIAYDLFSLKHNLTPRQACSLRCQLGLYKKNFIFDVNNILTSLFFLNFKAAYRTSVNMLKRILLN